MDATKQTVLTDDCQPFCKLFISCQSRECDLYDFFRHRNHLFPAELSDGGKLHACQKSQLAAVLESHVTLPDNEPQADVIIIDDSALVNILPPRTSNTFEDYAPLDILPTIRAYSIKYERTDIVFDVYQPSIMKAESRSKRGGGVAWSQAQGNKQMQRSFKLAQLIGRQLQQTELFTFLADKIEQMPSPNMVIVTKEENALSNHTISIEGVSPCSHEEAETQIFVHAMHAAQEGSESLLVKASDTDILVIAISVMPTLQAIGLQKLYIAFGQDRNMRLIPVHELYRSIGPEKGRGITLFHAFTGCDVVSAFRGKGKQSAW